MENNELQHHGVKGMRWGVRKDRKPSGTTKPKQKKEDNHDGKIQKMVDKCKIKVTKEQAKKAALKGAEIVNGVAVVAATDELYFGGVGRKIVKETVKQTGRAAVTAYVMANGGYDIHWYDK